MVIGYWLLVIGYWSLVSSVYLWKSVANFSFFSAFSALNISFVLQNSSFAIHKIGQCQAKDTLTEIWNPCP